MNEPVDRRRGATIERHIQTIGITLIVGAITTLASYLFNANSSNASQRTQLEVLTAQVLELRADIKSMQGTYVRRDEFLDHETRLRDQERSSA